MNKRKIFNDPVYGFVTIPSDLVFDLIEHPWFQRLRRIKQVGLTHYVYPGALHTRFQHALGAMHLMSQAIQVLRSKGLAISPEEEEAGIVAILLHDLGHGPYSHALEHLLLPVPHEEITLSFLHLLNDEFDGRLSLALQVFEGTYHRKFLNQLVSGQLDMDRLDYLKRDSFYTGVAEGIIGQDRIIAMLNVYNEGIVVEEKGLFSIEKFLVARKIMYLQVYLHKAVIAAEQMIRQSLGLLKASLLAGQSFPQLPGGLHRLFTGNASHDSPEALRIFAQLDDVEIDYTLKLMMHSADPVLSILSTGLIHRKLFKTTFSERAIASGVIDQTIQAVAKQYQISEPQAKALVLTGHEAVPAYDPQHGGIDFIRKDGSLAALPSLLPEYADSTVYHRYYLCAPAL